MRAGWRLMVEAAQALRDDEAEPEAIRAFFWDNNAYCLTDDHIRRYLWRRVAAITSHDQAKAIYREVIQKRQARYFPQASSTDED